jgi:hypothetical protein
VFVGRSLGGDGRSPVGPRWPRHEAEGQAWSHGRGGRSTEERAIADEEMMRQHLAPDDDVTKPPQLITCTFQRQFRYIEI